LTPTTLNFGTLPLGTSAQQSSTLTNTGTGTLNLSSIVLSGADYSLVATGTSCPYTGGPVAPGGTCTIDVAVKPTQAGTRVGTVTLTDDAADSPQTLSLTGTGLNPGPFIFQPLIPASTSPGGSDFTLTVNGTGLVATSVVNWNNSPLSTTFVSSGRLKAVVPSADIAQAGTAAVTVFTGGPGGGTSNVIYFEITNPTTSVTFGAATNYTAGLNPMSVAVGDFNGDGVPDLVVANNGDGTISVFMGKGDGTFQQTPTNYLVGQSPWSVAVGDFNGDGYPDLVVGTDGGSAFVLLNKADGTGSFGSAVPYSAGGSRPRFVAIGDFNGDGVLDLALSNFGNNTVGILQGVGDGTFKPLSTTVALASGANPAGLAVGDFNGDGQLDLAVAESGTGSVSILLGKGNGTFSAGQPVKSGGSPNAIAVGDFNGDGFLDLAVAKDVNTTVVNVFSGFGDGTFNLGDQISADISPVSLAVGDFNGDGILDLAVANNKSNDASVLLNNGNRNFQSPLNFKVGQAPQWVAVGDFNNDGRLDMAVVTANGVTVLLQTVAQAPAFTSANSVTFTAGIASSFTVRATGSPTPSLSESGTLPGGITFQDNGNGTGTLSGSATAAGTFNITFTAQNGVGSATQSFTLTVNANSTSIALASSANPSTVGQAVTFTATVIPSSGTLTPTGNVTFFDSTTTLGTTPLDTTGTGRLTTSSLTQGTHSITATYSGDPAFTGSTSPVLTQTVNANATNPAPFISLLHPASTAPGGPDFTLTVTGTEFVSGSVVNWNGSGLSTTFVNSGQLTATVPAADIMSAGTAAVTVVNAGPGGGTSNVLYFEITNSTTSVSFKETDYSTGGLSPNSVAVGDFNGDGTPDVVVANNGSNSVSVLLGKGDGTLQPAVAYAVGSGAYSVAVGDVNGDGKLDLVVGSASTNNVSVLLGNGDGTFQAAQSFSAGAEPRFVAIGDFNGDGKLDLAVSNLGNNTVGILLGNGNGTFSLGQKYTVGNGPAALVAGDFNHDDKLDLAVVNSGSGSVNILLGNGDGTFTVGQPIKTGGTPNSIAVGDFNGDGLLDLAVAKGANNSLVRVFIGFGDGTFNLGQDFTADASPVAVAVGDFNGDGALDLATANNKGIDASVLLNNNGGNFPSPLNFTVSSAPQWIAVGDFNNDGRLDMAVATTNGVSILLQTVPQAPAFTSNNNANFTVGTQSSFTVTATGSPTPSLSESGTLPGGITFQDNGDGTSTLSGIATGTGTFNVTFTAQNGVSPNATQSFALIVSQNSSVTALASSANPSTFGQAVTFTATVTQSSGHLTPTGNVTFSDGSTTLGTVPLDATGNATFNTSSLAQGTHTITANYSGDPNFTPSSASLQQTVNPNTTAISLASNPNPSFVGQPVTFTAVVKPTSPGGLTPTGTVVFIDGSTNLGSTPLDSSGTASISAPLTAAGTHTITAKYSGDPNFAPSSTSLPQGVNPAATTTSLVLSSGTNPSIYGQTLVFTASIKGQFGGQLTGTVAFLDGSTTLGSVPLSSGSANFKVNTLTTGTHSITAVYSGDPNFTGSTSAALSQTVNKATTTTTIAASPNPAALGQAVTFTAAVVSSTGAIPNGNVTFAQGSSVLGTASLDSTGHASVTTSSLMAGNNNVTASYAGSANFLASTSTSVTEVVNKVPTTTKLASSPNPSAFKQPVTFTATVTAATGGIPTGTVTFLDGNSGNQKLGSSTLNSSGQASFTTSGLGHGTHNVTAAYGGDSKFANSTSAILVQTVN
jgi:hypothetical protein